MKMLTPEELLELRRETASLGLSEERQDELIRLLDNIIISIIDQEFGWSPVQTSLSARANRVFLGNDSCERVRSYDRFGKVSSREGAATKPEQAAEYFAP